MVRTLRIGTRGSQLALVQARTVATLLAERSVPTELVIVRTEGDDRASDTAWGEGAFVGRIVAALLEGTVDVAVHSAKDIPTDEHPDLRIAAYPPREDPRDALVCRERGMTLTTLPHGARIGTDSPRRAAFLRALRPDLSLHPLHGNVDTRLARLDQGESDALVLAVAGLKRLDRADRIDEILPIDQMAPAPGQGSLAIQVRAADQEAIDAVSPLDDPWTRTEVVAERLLLGATGGGCRSPIGAVGRLDDTGFMLIAGAERTWTPDADAAFRVGPIVWVRAGGDPEEHGELARRLAARIVSLRARPRVLATRTDEQAVALLDALEQAGLDAVNVPAIAIERIAAGGPLDAALATVEAGTWIVVTSANGARAVLGAIDRLGTDRTALRWAVVGSRTAEILRKGGIADAFEPRASTAADLAQELPLAVGDIVLMPRTDAADSALSDALRRRGARIQEVLAYRTREAPPASRARLAQARDDGPLDAIVLTSGSTARGIVALADTVAWPGVLRTPVVAIGEPTAWVARDIGFGQVLVGRSSTPAALADLTARAFGIRQPATIGGAPWT